MQHIQNTSHNDIPQTPHDNASHAANTNHKWIVRGYFFTLFVIFLLFFGYAYPAVPFWGDDWTYLNSYPPLKPVWGSWIPARILPVFLGTSGGILSAYVVMPLSGLDFIDSITCVSAILLSSASLGLCYAIYRLTLHFSASKAIALFGVSVFVIAGFCASKAHYMPLFFPVDLREEGIGYALTVMDFYILPNLLNLVLLCGVMYYQAVAYRLVSVPKVDSKAFAFITGGGNPLSQSAFYDKLRAYPICVLRCITQL